MVESKFKISSIFAIIVSLLFLLGFTYILAWLGFPNLPLFASIPLLLFLLFFIVWLFFGEARTKLVKVSIENDAISVRGFMGIGVLKRYYFNEFEGYKTAILPSEYQEFEYLYLFLKGRKAIKISQFYHSNYAEMKLAIAKKTKNLGIERFNFGRELREIFIF